VEFGIRRRSREQLWTSCGVPFENRQWDDGASQLAYWVSAFVALPALLQEGSLLLMLV
jgi:hypothetical protein